MGKEFEKRIDTCICITKSLCCISKTNMTLLINYNIKIFLNTIKIKNKTAMTLKIQSFREIGLIFQHFSF